MYGVDECRRCGVKIHPHGPDDRAQVEAFNRSKKKMPEAEWRKMGLLAAPTPKQIRLPATGCCHECGLLLVQQKMKPFRRLGKAMAGCAIAFAAIGIIATYVLY